MGLADAVVTLVRAAHGDEAVAALARAADAAGQPVAIVAHGPVWWIALGPKVLARPRFFVDGEWRELNGREAFAQALAATLPPVQPWGPLVKAWTALTLEDVLATEADVRDAADPGFNLFPLSLAARQRWEPPGVVDGVLRFMACRHGAAHVVRVDGRSLAVELEPVG
jgi:hypothetical protein